MSGPNFRCKIASLSATHHGASWWVECRTAEVLFAVALSPCHESSMSVYFCCLSCVNESTPNFQLSFWCDFLCRPLTTERIWSKVLPKRAELPAAHAERPFGLSTSARLQIDWCRSAPARHLSLRSQQPFPSQSFTAGRASCKGSVRACFKMLNNLSIRVCVF